MKQIITEIDFDREIIKIVEAVKAVSPVLEEGGDEILIQKIYEALPIDSGMCVDLEKLALKLTIENIEKKFQGKKDKFQVLYKHKSDREMYQKRIFSVQERFKKEFPNIKIFIIDNDNDFNYVLYVKNKIIFKSKKFRDFCDKIKYEYEENYGEVNYTVELKEGK